MYRISRYFAVSSAVVFLAAMLVMVFIYRHNAIKDLIAIVEDNNVILANTFSRMIHTEFPDYLIGIRETEGAAQARLPDTPEVDKVIRSLIEGLSVLKVKIYTPQGYTAYSSDATQIGEQRTAAPNAGAFQQAAKRGRAQSRLSYRDQISAFSGELFGRDVVETYVPVRGDTGAIIGVFELYSDVTRLKESIDTTVIGMIAGTAAVFVLLYAILVLVIMRRVVTSLERASALAAAIGPRNPGLRLPTRDMPAEVLPLIGAINSALDRLDEALASQRRFTADAAHELLTPLAVLTSHLDTLEDARAVAGLRQDVETMTAIVSQLLVLAEFDTPEMEADPIADARAVCVDAIAALVPLAVRRQRDIELTGAHEPVYVRCGANALRRVLDNVIKNAIEHTPENSRVEVHLDDQGTIRISDQGPGIAPEHRERVFDRFWRGPGQASRPGAGLGLAIVRHVIDTCGGSIEIGGAPGAGTVFSLKFQTCSAPERNP